MRFGTDEEVPMRIETDAATEMSHKVVAADEVRASRKAALEEGLIKAQAFPSDAGLHFSANILQARREDSVEIVEKRAVRLEPSVETTATLPGDFATDSEWALEENIGTEHRVGTPSQAHRDGVTESVEASRRCDCADAEGCVELLGGSWGGEDGEASNNKQAERFADSFQVHAFIDAS